MEALLEDLPRSIRLEKACRAVAGFNFDSYAQVFRMWDDNNGKNCFGKWDLPGIEGYSYGYDDERKGFFVYSESRKNPIMPLCPIQPCKNYSAGTRKCPDHFEPYFKTNIDYKPKLPATIVFPIGKGKLFRNGDYNISDIKILFEFLLREFETRDPLEMLEKLGHSGRVLHNEGILVTRYTPHSRSLYIQRLDNQSVSFIVCSGLDCYEEAYIPDFFDMFCSKKCMSIIKHKGATKFQKSDFIQKLASYIKTLALSEQSTKKLSTEWDGYVEVYKKIWEHGERGICFQLDGVQYALQMLVNGQLRVSWSGAGYFSRDHKMLKYLCQYLDCLSDQVLSTHSFHSKKTISHQESFICVNCRKNRARTELNLSDLFASTEFGKNGNLASFSVVFSPILPQVKVGNGNGSTSTPSNN